MEQQELETQYKLERDICAGANASEYHKKRFAELAKELGITVADKITKLADEVVKAQGETIETPETETISTQSDKIESVAVEEKPDEAS